MQTNRTDQTNTIPIERVEGSVMLVNSYVVDCPDGLVVVDGQLTVSDALAVRKVVDAASKPVAGLVLTHGHPDHYAGAGVLLDGLSAPVVATPAVDAVIRRDDAEKEAIVGPMMGDEWPTDRRFPDLLVDPGEAIQLGGAELTVRALGPGESHEDALWLIDDRTVFSGDVAYNDMHAYLADGRFTEWLAVLDRLEAELDPQARLHVGHGEPTGVPVLASQRRYVEAFVEAIEETLDARGTGAP